MSLPELLGVVLGIAFLHAYFRALQQAWPYSYYSLRDVVSFRISATPLRYSLFRFLPVAVVCFFVATTLRTNDIEPVAAIALLTVGHIGLTMGRSVWRIATSKVMDFSRASLVLAHLLATTGVVAAALAGLVASGLPQAGRLVPTGRELAAALWTAVFASVVTAFFIRQSAASRVRVEDIVERSLRQLSSDVKRAARTASERHSVEYRLLLALLIVENLQRPRWVRLLEAFKGKLIPQGTYGVMQVYSPEPIDDIESIERAAADRLAGLFVPTDEYGTPMFDDVRQELDRYNRNPRFLELVGEVYSMLTFGDLTDVAESERPE